MGRQRARHSVHPAQGVRVGAQGCGGSLERRHSRAGPQGAAVGRGLGARDCASSASTPGCAGALRQCCTPPGVPLSALAQVCKFVLTEEGVPKGELQARAAGLKLLGEQGSCARVCTCIGMIAGRAKHSATRRPVGALGQLVLAHQHGDRCMQDTEVGHCSCLGLRLALIRGWGGAKMEGDQPADRATSRTPAHCCTACHLHACTVLPAMSPLAGATWPRRNIVVRSGAWMR